MTNNHLLLYRLAELMLEKQQHILALDDLFEDEQIGAFVRSIQIDSPYQQLIFEGVLTETINEERVMVTFTVEGYFHYVLGEVIEKQTEGKGAEALKKLLENNKLRGITEGLEQCLVRDVEKNDLSRLMGLIDEGGKALDASAYPLAQAFLIYSIERVMDELLADPTDNDIEVLEKAIEKLEEAQKNKVVEKVYLLINNKIKPKNTRQGKLYLRSIEYVNNDIRENQLDKLVIKNILEDVDDLANYYYEFGTQYRNVSLFEKALVFHEKTLSIDIVKYGNNHPETASTLSSIANDWSKKGNYKKAIENYQKALTIRIKHYGEFDISIARAYNNLALNWSNLGENYKAIQLFQMSLKIKLKIIGKNHPSVAISYNNIGFDLKVLGKYDEAIKNYNHALDIKTKIYGKNHKETAISYNSIGLFWRNRKEFDKALNYLEKSLPINIKYYGEYHPITAKAYNNIGFVWDAKKDYTQALKYYKKALDIRQIKLGELHLDTGVSYNNIGLVYKNQKKYKEAFLFLKKSLKIILKNLGENHPRTATNYNNLGILFNKQGHYNKAVKYYKMALSINLNKHGRNHPILETRYNNLGIACFKNRNYKSAIKYFKLVLTYCPEENIYYYYIGSSYKKLKYFQKAIENYVISANMLKVQNGIDDKDTKEAIQEALRLAEETDNIKLLPDWIKK